MRGIVKLAATPLFGAVLAWCAPSQAAVVVQTANFSHNGLAVFQDTNPVAHSVVVNKAVQAATPVHFAGFDPGLGTLTGVNVALTSDQHYGVGVSIFGNGAALLTVANIANSVRFGGQAVGGLLQGYTLSEAPNLNLPCTPRENEPGCQISHGADRPFDFSVALSDLDPFLQAGGVDFDAASSIVLFGAGGVGGNALVNAFGGLVWDGNLSLTYTYEPTVASPPGGVPEPATWALLIAGFGLAGAQLRRRRGTQRQETATRGVSWRTAALSAVVLAGAGQAGAAEVIRTANFNHFHTSTVTDGANTFREPHTFERIESDDTLVHFAEFDPALGTLTGVRLALSSEQDFGVGLSIVGEGSATLSIGNYFSAVQLGGDAVGGFSRYLFDLDVKELPCTAFGFCYNQVQVSKDFDFDVPIGDLNRFLSPDGVDLAFVSTIAMDTFVGGYLRPGAVFNMASALTWGGDVSLTYIYDPAVAPPGGVPEPATWALLIGGFGLAGARLRRRRAGRLA